MSNPADDLRDTLDRLASFVSAPQERSDLCAGVVIGNFQLQVKLGRGRMGEVWKAWDTKAERAVVLKLVPPELRHAGEEMTRVKAAFQRIHALQHQHICPVHYLDEDRRFGWYLVMKYIDGQTLSAYRATYVARHGAFPVGQLIKVLRPVAEALDYAARAAGDPPRREAAKHLGAGRRGGRADRRFRPGGGDPYHGGPREPAADGHVGHAALHGAEQWKGQPQDARTDQYALAVVAYELISGRLPFESAELEILRLCVLNDPPAQLAGQPRNVDRAIARAMAKRREERFGTCRQFVEALVTPALENEFAVDLGNGVKLEMVLIPAGEFLMGSPDSDNDAGDHEKPQHRVRITRPFYLGKYLVTQEQWQAVTGSNPSAFMGPKNPVEHVSWDDCQEFLKRLNGVFRRILPAREGEFRLPTEAQWEFACRAGSTTRYCFGDDASALGQYGTLGGKTQPVGKKRPNAWGLYDMHGNVWEWCQDWYHESYYANSPTDDPTGPVTGSYRVFRGGSCNYVAGSCRSAYRRRFRPEFRSDCLGFRVSQALGDE